VFNLNFSNEFKDRYKRDLEMDDVVTNTNKVLSPHFLDDENYRNREILYETIYGYKLTVADPYNLDMDKIYKNIAHFEKVNVIMSKDMDSIGDSNTLGYFSVKGDNFKTDKQCFSTITIIADKNKTIDGYRETLTHELVHLFSQEYFEDENGVVDKIGRCGLLDNSKGEYINEVMTQTVTLDILETLHYAVEDRQFSKEIDDNYANEVILFSRGNGYASISQVGNALETIFDKSIYSEMFDNTHRFQAEINAIYGESTNNPVRTVNYLLDSCFNDTNAESTILLYKEIANISFDKIDNQHSNIVDYLNTMRNVNNGYGCALMVNDKYVDMFNPITSSREIEHFYNTFNKSFNPETDLDKEINPFTRSKDCSNFLIVMQALKISDIDYDLDKIQNLKWKEISRDGDDISLVYKCDDKLYHIQAKIDLNTGILICEENKEISNMREITRPSILKKLAYKESELTSENNFEFISKLSKISDYSETVIKHSKIPENIIINSIISSNYESFEKNIDKVDFKNIKDSNDNNLLHMLAKNNTKDNSLSFLMDIEKQNNKVANELYNSENIKGKTPIEIAINNKNFEFIEKAYNCQLNIKNIEACENILVNGKPMINYFQDNSYYSGVAGLIKDNYDTSLADKNGDTILHVLMKTDDLYLDKRDIVNALMQKNINPDIENKNHLTPLMEACKMDYPFSADVEYLCGGLKANVNYTNSEDRTAIHYLLEHSINQKDNYMGRHNLVLDELIYHGADVNIPCNSFNHDKELILPVQIACGSEHIDASNNLPQIDYKNITTLIENGADINKSYGDIPSALAMAHQTNDLDMFKSFIDGGISVNNLNTENSNLNMSSKLELIKYEKDNEKDNEKAVEDTKLIQKDNTKDFEDFEMDF